MFVTTSVTPPQLLRRSKTTRWPSMAVLTRRILPGFQFFSSPVTCHINTVPSAHWQGPCDGSIHQGDPGQGQLYSAQVQSLCDGVVHPGGLGGGRFQVLMCNCYGRWRAEVFPLSHIQVPMWFLRGFSPSALLSSPSRWTSWPWVLWSVLPYLK